MGTDFVNRVIKNSLVLAVICTVVAWFYGELSSGLGILAGAVWGSINLFFLTHLIQNCIVETPKHLFKIGMLLGIKFPLLYLTGYFLLAFDYFPIMALLWGFSITITVIFLNSVRQMSFQR